jgi:hypothetical protein
MLVLATRDDPAADIASGWHQLKAAGWASTLPLLVELRTFASPQWREKSFLDLIDHQQATQNLGLPRQALEPYLRGGGQACVIFDGLDEVFDPALREQITRQIEAFASLYSRARVIVTSRVVGYRRAMLDTAGFTHWMLQDLDTPQIQAFASAWYAASCQEDPVEGAQSRERLLTAIRDSAAVAELAGNPMLLTILAIIGRRQELPRERRLVYEHAVSVLVEHWDATGKHLQDKPGDVAMPYLSREGPRSPTPEGTRTAATGSPSTTTPAPTGCCSPHAPSSRSSSSTPRLVFRRRRNSGTRSSHPASSGRHPAACSRTRSSAGPTGRTITARAAQNNLSPDGKTHPATPASRNRCFLTARGAIFLAPDCPARGHRVNGGRRMRSATPTIDPVTTHKGFGACEETRAVGGSQHPAAIVVSNPAWFIAAASRLQQIRCTSSRCRAEGILEYARVDSRSTVPPSRQATVTQ